jgi:hypothetical protein
MDSALIAAIVTSLATAGSTAGVAVVAILTQNRRIDRLEKKFDDLEAIVRGGFEGVNTKIELLTGAMHELDKRLGIVEDRMFGRKAE